VQQPQHGGDTAQDDADSYDAHAAQPADHVAAEQLYIDLERRNVGLCR
jgi:hypothetical protein